MIDILKVESKKQLRQFIDFPHDLYSGDPNYVPMLYMEQEALLNPKKSPFWQHSKAEYFLAKKDGKIVGRIAAIRNNNHIAFTGKQEGFFGFFDVVNDFEIAKKLLDTAAEWLRKEGLEKMLGPASFSTNEVVGLLVENFNEPPFVMNGYNAPYYVELVEKYGFTKLTDLLCYDFRDDRMPHEIVEFAEKLEARLAERGITIRQVNMKKYQEEIERFLPVYNASWAENTGFVPMTDAEVRQIGKDLKAIVDPGLIYFAEKEGKIIGVALAIPNVNEVQIKLRRGRLFPFGVFKLLFGLKKIKSIRILALGTLKEYRRLGIDVCFYVRIIKYGLGKGINRAEASWILENNDMMNRALIQIKGEVYRKYRLYEKSI
jgi:GNAT superfamily N-acetyltransferase